MGVDASASEGRRAALVTGASSGIGLAIAAMLAEEGYDLTLASRTQAKLEAAAESPAFAAVQVLAVPTDVGDPTAIKALVDAHRERFGRLDVLVNNAGLGIAGELAEIKDKHIDLQLNVNLRAPIVFCREAEPLLRAAGAAHGEALIVNTSSITGKIGEPGLGVYSATKHGLVGFTQAMQRELGPAGVKSTVLCPAFVDTALSDYVKGEVAPETMIRSEDVAESVRSLLRLSSACVVPEIVMLQRGVIGLP
jgi:NAD(P)-dependent dehydrogenase (short-subunit alcohol dehydrogenase family)